MTAKPGKVIGPAHVVKEGDTLYEIARANHLTVRDLKEANHLRTTRLHIGQRLILASTPVSTSRSKGRVSRARGVQTSSKSERAVAEDVSKVAPEGVGATPPTTRSAESLVKGSSLEGVDSTQQDMRAQLVQAGLDFLGVPYRWKGISERRGVDCSGLVKTLFEKFDIDLPHSSREQFKLGEKVAKAELAVGDLVFFSTRGKIPTHVGIYIGDNQFLHAARHARQVIISNLSQSWYQKRYIGARRISDLWKDEPKPAEGKGN